MRSQQFGVNTHRFQRLQNRQHISRLHTITEQQCDLPTFDLAIRNGVEAQAVIFSQAIHWCRRLNVELLIRQSESQVIRHALRQFSIDACQMIYHTLTDISTRHFTQFKRVGTNNVLLLDFSLAQPEQARLRIILTK